MPDILITPPIRTPLTSSDGDAAAGATPDSSSVTRTTRDWWLYWNRLGTQANSNAKLVTQGTHADRPTATDSPDGALYVETDRGAIYQARNGVWQYLAGTMWGTVTPDERPTDLGVNDGGFDFRGTDDAREFIWSQTQWIEVTEVRYGTHAARPNPLDVANGALYVEFDRGAMYQNQNNVWKYLAGTMWGTLSPDQRPTDLGVNDGGFDFRGTDQQREFIWSQSAWIEVTPVTGALNLTHPNVVAKVGSAGQIVEGGITDESAANSDHLHVTAAGNVGIETSGPPERLSVFNGSLMINAFGDAGSTQYLAQHGIFFRSGFGSQNATESARRNVSITTGRGTGDLGDALDINGSHHVSIFTNGAEAMRITASGAIAVLALPSANPGAGTKQLWYDPADGNRVKFAP